MSLEFLLAFVPMLILWVVYRVGRFAVGPLLADARAARAVQPRLALPSATVRGSPVRPLQALALAAIAFVGSWFAVSSGLSNDLRLLDVALGETYYYSYYPAYDLALNAAIAVGLLLFARSGIRAALAAFAVLSILSFLADFVFNLGGSYFFEYNYDLYAGGPLGASVWSVYYAISIVLSLIGLSFFCYALKAPGAWISVLVLTLATSLLLTQSEARLYLGEFRDMTLVLLAPSIVMAATIGWWLRPNET